MSKNLYEMTLTGVWLSARETGEILGLHVNTIKRMPPTELPYYRVCSRGDRRYRSEDVVAYLEKWRIDQ